MKTKLILIILIKISMTSCKTNNNISETEAIDTMGDINLNTIKYGKQTLEGMIVKEVFIDKRGREHPDIYDLFLKTDKNKYFIRLMNSKIRRKELMEYLDKKAVFKINVQSGLWDTDDPNVQSRVGDYCEIYEIEE